MDLLNITRDHLLALPNLAKFALVLAVLVGVPRLAGRLGLPGMVGLLLFGIVLGPHVFDVFGQNRPIANFFAELGKLLLMFSAGLEIDVALFRKAQSRALGFGTITTVAPLVLGTLFGLTFGYTVIPAIVIGSLLASHTLLGLPIVARLGGSRLEPVVVTVGATVVSDTLSLLVFAVCASTFTAGFSVISFGRQIGEIVVVVPLILFGVSRAGAAILECTKDNEEAYFVTMLGIMAIAGLLADIIGLPGIVGAFLAGLAVNAAVQGHPAKEKLEFLAKALFIPSFFIVTGFLIAPVPFVRSVTADFPFVLGLIGALLAGKGIAAALVGRAFGYPGPVQLTVWSLTLPQVAATLAATLVAYDTTNGAGQHLLDGRVLNAVLVLMLTTAILGPLLTERFAPRMLGRGPVARTAPGVSA